MKVSIRMLATTLATTLVITGCSGKSGGEDQADRPVALVALSKAGTGDIAQTITLYGEMTRDGGSQITLAAPIEATVQRIVAPAGSAVAAGQIVARLAPSPASQAQYQATASDAAAARQALARAQRLRNDGLGSDADVEAARAQAAAASALLSSLDKRDATLLLRAPRAAYVDSTNANAGDLVQPGTVIATLFATGDSRALFGIDPAQARSLAAGASIEIRPADGSAPFTAAIASINPVAQAQTRLASVLVDIPASHRLAAGQPLSATVAIRSSQAAVSIPYAALLDDGGQPFVFVVRDGVAQRRDVRIGASDGQRVAILAGVKDGDMVVTAGGTAVDDGMQVRTR